MVLTPRTSHGNYYWPPCYRHGTSKCALCERAGNECTEQDEAIRESTQAARDAMASHNDKDGQEDAQNDNEPPSKKAKHQEYTVTEGIFDFVESLDDQHLVATLCIVKAAIEYRQENIHSKEQASTCIMEKQFCSK